ncbi:MAG TPA: hypothetical protein VHN80_06835 [Kineosporiaceae bacterium]|nr:hypothetical protein [Kineosporiaceae bacterium]
MADRAGLLTRPAYRARALEAPRADVFSPPPPQRQLLVRQHSAAGEARPAWLFVAAHGGSGASLLARLSWQPYKAAVEAGAAGRSAELAFGMTAGRAWPNPALEPTSAAVVVCRTTMRGLAWARDLAAQYLSGCVPAGLRLLGVVTVADQPGRLPPPLAAARGLLAGAYPHCWAVPYVPAYRLLTGLPDEPCPPIHPAVDDVLTAIRRTVTSEGQP